MPSIKIIFKNGQKNTLIEVEPSIIFSDLLALYFKRECISKQQKNELNFFFLKQEIKPSSNSKLSDLGLKNLSEINVELKRKPLESFSLKEYQKELEEAKIKTLKKEILAREEKMRKGNLSQAEKRQLKIKRVLENMCIYSNRIKKEIKEEKEKNPEKFEKIEEILKNEEKDKSLFALALLAKALENSGIETVIAKYDEKGTETEEEIKEKENEYIACLQFLSNGFMEKTKYDLHFDFGPQRNEQILNDEKEFEKFKNDLIIKISKDYNIPPDQIIVTYPQRGSVHVQVVFQSNEFNELNINEFTEKFKNDDEFKELKNLKEIHRDVMFDSCKLLRKHLDSRGNRSDGWGIGEKRGNKPYDPPIGWTGIGLNVKDRFDDGNNDWIGMCNSKNEWCVAYHGVGRFKQSKEVKEATGNIIKDKFIVGPNQAHNKCKDIFHNNKEINNDNLVGNGVYCTPIIKTAESYAGESIINDIPYKTVLMVRVKPDAIRGCTCKKDYWVVDGTSDTIRPYRILYKRV